jgi:hypothetical protein
VVSRAHDLIVERGNFIVGRRSETWVMPDSFNMHNHTLELYNILGAMQRATGQRPETAAAARGPMPDLPPPRVWHSAQGTPIEARLVSHEPPRVVLETRDGRQITVSLDQLSEADQDFLRDGD